MKQLFLILCIVPLLLACSSDDKTSDTDYSDLIVGEWSMIHAVGHETGKDGHVYDKWDNILDNYYYTFFENSKGREFHIKEVSGKLEITEFEWAIFDSKLVIKENPGGKDEYMTTPREIKELTKDKMVLYTFIDNGKEVVENTQTLKKRK